MSQCSNCVPGSLSKPSIHRLATLLLPALRNGLAKTGSERAKELLADWANASMYFARERAAVIVEA